MWYEKSIFYQIYPLGFCGAPEVNDGVVTPRILKVKEWIPHLKNLNIDAIYFSPVFESDYHGYDTRDYEKIDCRLGSNDDFVSVCKSLKENGIHVVLDGVFNHVGRGFWAFEDVITNRQNSKYCDWFSIDFNGNSNYNDGFWYEGWEGHYELVKLNLNNSTVVEYLFSCIQTWVELFDIDGLRLDVAYCLNTDFMKKLRGFCTSLKDEFLLVGEILFGDYKRIVNPEMLHSCTNYECYKGLYSSFNDRNLFEISYALNRQFGIEGNAIYKDLHLLSFVDNHDVARVSSILRDKNHIPLIYGLLFGMPGIPCIYYASEWGIDGTKQNGSDALLRPCVNEAQWNDLTTLISNLARIRKENAALQYGTYKSIVLTNRQIVFERLYQGERIWIGINTDDTAYTARIGSRISGTNLLTDELVCVDGSITFEPYELFYWKIEA